VLFAQVERGEGHAMLAGKADYQSAGALGFLVWVYLSPEYKESGHIFILHLSHSQRTGSSQR
jgi:hypothetical protein